MVLGHKYTCAFEQEEDEEEEEEGEKEGGKTQELLWLEISQRSLEDNNINSKPTGPSPVEMFLHHFGDGAGHGLLLRGQALVEVHAQPLLQEVHDEL